MDFIAGTLLLSLREARLPCRELFGGEARWQGAEGGLWPAAREARKASEALRILGGFCTLPLRSVVQHPGGRILTTSMRVSVDTDASPVEFKGKQSPRLAGT